MPIGFTLLFLMAVAPVLPWRKASGELLRTRLLVPGLVRARRRWSSPWCVGARGLAPLLAFALAGFAAGAAVRQLVLATRRQGWRGLVGRANGGMVVHLGRGAGGGGLRRVVVLRRRGARCGWLPGESATVGGHTVTFEGIERQELPERVADVAQIRVDGGPVYEPSINRYRARAR